MSFSKIGAIKMVVSGIVGMGASRIAGQIIKNNVTAPTNLLEKVALMAGTWAIGGIIAERSRKHTDDAIDQVVGIVKKVQEGVQTDIKLNRINKETSTFEDEGLNAEDFEKNVAGKWVRIKKEPKQNGWVQASNELFEFYEGGDITASYFKMPSGEWKFEKASSE